MKLLVLGGDEEDDELFSEGPRPSLGQEKLNLKEEKEEMRENKVKLIQVKGHDS